MFHSGMRWVKNRKGMRKILFIASHRKDRAPGQRFRFEQYFDFLSQNGFECELSYIISEEDDKMLYKKGAYLKKFLFSIKCHLKRMKDARNSNKYDIIFVFREALMTRSTYFEEQFSKSKAKVVFDFDDSIWLQNVSDANKKLAFLKNAGKTAELIQLSDMIFAGNQFLADYAAQNNDNIRIVPTTIDTEEYIPIKASKKEGSICIGWSGSITTIQHFEVAIPILRKVKEKYGDLVYFKVIGDAHYKNTELGIKGLGWNKQDEVTELSSFDIGIMPLPNDEWASGKCGLKGLQYMALKIPTIMSPVGVNTQIITDGVNGFLADEENEWLDKISSLIDSKLLREKIGKEARETVVKSYSVESEKSNYLKYFNELLSK